MANLLNDNLLRSIVYGKGLKLQVFDENAGIGKMGKQCYCQTLSVLHNENHRYLAKMPVLALLLKGLE